MTNLLFKQNMDSLSREITIRGNSTPTLQLNQNGGLIPMAREDLQGVQEASILNRIPNYTQQMNQKDNDLQNQIDNINPVVSYNEKASVVKQIGINSGTITLSYSGTVVSCLINGEIFTGEAFVSFSNQTLSIDLGTEMAAGYSGTVYIYLSGQALSAYSARIPAPTLNNMLIGSLYMQNGAIQADSLATHPFNTVTSRVERISNATQASGLVMTPSGTHFSLSNFNYFVEGINWNVDTLNPNLKSISAQSAPFWTGMYPGYTPSPIDSNLGSYWWNEAANELWATVENKYYIWIPALVPSGQLLFLYPQTAFDDYETAVNGIINAHYNLTGISSRLTFFGFCYVFNGKDYNNVNEWQVIGQLPTEIYSLPASALGPQAVISSINISINGQANESKAFGFNGFPVTGIGTSEPSFTNGVELNVVNVPSGTGGFTLDFSRTNKVILNGQRSISVTAITGVVGSNPSYESAVIIDNTASTVDCKLYASSGVLTGEFVSGVEDTIPAGEVRQFFYFNGFWYGRLESMYIKDLSGKANTDLGNVVSAGKATSVGWGMPNWRSLTPGVTNNTIKKVTVATKLMIICERHDYPSTTVLLQIYDQFDNPCFGDGDGLGVLSFGNVDAAACYQFDIPANWSYKLKQATTGVIVWCNEIPFLGGGV